MSDERDKPARLRDEEDREGFAIRRLERAMTDEEHELERRLGDLEADIEGREAAASVEAAAVPCAWRSTTPS